VLDLDTLMILADEYEELEKEREVFPHEKNPQKDQVGITNASNMQKMRRDRNPGVTGKRPMVAT